MNVTRGLEKTLWPNKCEANFDISLFFYMFKRKTAGPLKLITKLIRPRTFMNISNVIYLAKKNCLNKIKQKLTIFIFLSFRGV